MKRKKSIDSDETNPPIIPKRWYFPAFSRAFCWNTIYTLKEVKRLRVGRLVIFLLLLCRVNQAHARFYTQRIAVDKLANRSRDFKSPFRWIRRDSIVPWFSCRVISLLSLPSFPIRCIYFFPYFLSFSLSLFLFSLFSQVSRGDSRFFPSRGTNRASDTTSATIARAEIFAEMTIPVVKADPLNVEGNRFPTR